MSEEDIYGVFNQIIIRAIHFCVVGGLINPLNVGCVSYWTSASFRATMSYRVIYFPVLSQRNLGDLKKPLNGRLYRIERLDLERLDPLYFF